MIDKIERKVYSCLLVIIILPLLFIKLNAQQDQDPPRQVDKESEEYRLQMGDEILMSIYQEPEMSRKFLIGKTDHLSFPLIEHISVKAKGLTVRELQEKLREIYNKDYFVDAKVSVQIVNYVQKWVTVTGAVHNPSANIALPHQGKLTLSMAIAKAGGISENANKYNILLTRAETGNKSKHRYTDNVLLQEGDTVTVPFKIVKEVQIEKFFTVSGYVRSPGRIKLPRSGRIDIFSAISEAGGYARAANQSNCELKRKANNFRTEPISLSDIRRNRKSMVFLTEGDILNIKESRW